MLFMFSSQTIVLDYRTIYLLDCNRVVSKHHQHSISTVVPFLLRDMHHRKLGLHELVPTPKRSANHGPLFLRQFLYTFCSYYFLRNAGISFSVKLANSGSSQRPPTLVSGCFSAVVLVLTTLGCLSTGAAASTLEESFNL